MKPSSRRLGFILNTDNYAMQCLVGKSSDFTCERVVPFHGNIMTTFVNQPWNSTMLLRQCGFLSGASVSTKCWTSFLVYPLARHTSCKGSSDDHLDCCAWWDDSQNDTSYNANQIYRL